MVAILTGKTLQLIGQTKGVTRQGIYLIVEQTLHQVE